MESQEQKSPEAWLWHTTEAQSRQAVSDMWYREEVVKGTGVTDVCEKSALSLVYTVYTCIWI